MSTARSTARSSHARRVLVTGGAGFVGSHLCEALVQQGDQVVCVDNLSTGSLDNLRSLRDRPGFEFSCQDVTRALHLEGPLDAVMHLASPASPADYLRLPLETLAAGSAGTTHALELARAHRARFVLASTSEVYGDPLRHPQVEQDWGHVNPIGPRSVYDEAKRFAEAVTMAYHRSHGLEVAIARIFNTYGPRLRPSDGRVVSNFVVRALAGAPLVLYGDGTQTRSFCYIDDLVQGLLALLDTAVDGPVNLGNPEEHTVAELAHLIISLTESGSEVVRGPLPADDPVRRRPDISRARAILGWGPEVALPEGLSRTIAWFATGGGQAVTPLQPPRPRAVR